MRKKCPTCHFDWTELPSLTIGGASGDYFIDCPIDSHEVVEYKLVNIANFDTTVSNVASVVLSGLSKPTTPPTTSQPTVNSTNALQGSVWAVPGQSSGIYWSGWEYVSHPRKRVHIRIDTPGASQVYVSIKFRVHSHVQGAPHAVHVVNDPEHEELVQHAYEQAILQKMGYIDHPERIPI